MKPKREFITIPVEPGTKHRLRQEAGKRGLKGVSELLREYIYIGLKHKEDAIAGQKEGNNV